MKTDNEIAIEKAKCKEAVALVQSELRKLQDDKKAVEMAAYMKTTMPFYGVQKPERIPIFKNLCKIAKPDNRLEYEALVLALWNLPYREEKYLALELACKYSALADVSTLSLYKRMVQEGSWWDFVDVIAGHLVGDLLARNRTEIEPIMNKWINDDCMWLRRTAILCQMRHKSRTNESLLYSFCLARAHESEFFIRKAIGWALREYSYCNPASVEKFLKNNRERLSNLSYREAAKRLIKAGVDMS